MTKYEYKAVPAVARGHKQKGVKAAEDRFALALEMQLNALAAEGWEYCRAEMLPSLERAGLTGTTTEWRHVLIFRRPVEQAEMEALPAPDMMEEPAPDAAPEADVESAPDDDTSPSEPETQSAEAAERREPSLTRSPFVSEP